MPGRLSFHLPVGRIILHYTVLVELDRRLEPAALVLVCSDAEVRVSLLAGCGRLALVLDVRT